MLMKKLFVFTAYLCLLAFYGQAQQQTFILVRHAEKVADGSKDPALTELGEKRARMLAELLQNEKIDSVLSTDYKRTRATVQALAEQQNKTVGLYAPMQQGQMLEGLKATGKEGTFVIAGHSNTVPHLVNYLLQEERLSDLEDDEYEKIFIVSRFGDEARVIVLSYPDIK